MASTRTQNNAKPKRKATGRPFEKGHKWRWPKGVSGNPGGRPAGVSEAYRAWLELPYENDPTMTNAQALAVAQGAQALQGDIGAAREIRQATEGTRLNVSALSDDELLRLLAIAERGGDTGGGSAAGTEATAGADSEAVA